MINAEEYERLKELKEKSESLALILDTECSHVWGVWRHRLNSNGVKHYGRQCLNCGQLLVTKKILVPVPLDELPEIDKQIQERYQKDRGGIFKHKCNIDSLIREIEAKINREVHLAAYYSSETWAIKRKYRLRLNEKLFNGLCEICFSAPASHIHHLTYERLHKEYIFDLAAICESCHCEQHPHMMQRENDS
jgi:RNase P subunit RPR2